MTDADKVAAFDSLAEALLHDGWYDGSWSWFCLTPCGGESKATREEALADLLEWAVRIRKWRKSHATFRVGRDQDSGKACGSESGASGNLADPNGREFSSVDKPNSAGVGG